MAPVAASTSTGSPLDAPRLGEPPEWRLVHAENFARPLEVDAKPGVAAAFAGAVLEKHLRELVEARTGSTVEDRRAKLGRFAADLKRIKVFTASEVQLVNRIEGFRDNGAHGRFDRVTASDAAWTIREAGDLARRHPLVVV